MYRYVILHWRQDDPTVEHRVRKLVQRLRNSPSSWRLAVDAAGFAVLDAGIREGTSETYRLGCESGAVMGTLFVRGVDRSTASARLISDPEAARIVASDGRRLLSHYWGRYVAVVRSSADGVIRVLRDPSGAMPCFETTSGSVRVFFSSIDVCLELGIESFAINWRYIRSLVVNRYLQVAETGLEGVTELQPGECITLAGGATRRERYWLAEEIAGAELDVDSRTSETLLQQTTRACIHAWASRYASLVHRLSGGLDSSIVLACLQDAPSSPEVRCLNDYAPDSAADERPFARLTARRTGYALTERPMDPTAVPLERYLSIAPSPKPWFYLYYAQQSHIDAEFARQRNATAIFSGGGGDALYFQSRGRLAPIDFVRLRGLRPGLLRVALDAAYVDRESLWPLLWDAVADLWRPHAAASRETRRTAALVSHDVVDAVRKGEGVDRSASDLGHLPPGKRRHIEALLVPASFYDPLGRADDPEIVLPLMSQPLVELCLRIPTFRLIEGGYDRAIARRAFAPYLPKEVVERRSKGSTTGQVKHIFHRNLPFIRELLLDGALVREGILARKPLEAALSPRSTLTSMAFSDIVSDYLSTEAWLRGWTSSTYRAVA